VSSIFRRLAAAMAATAPLMALAADNNVPAPYYTAGQALQGVYTHHLPPLATTFADATGRLTAVTRQYCAGSAPHGAVREQWLLSLQAWQTLSTPAVGPVVTRRSQREIDFWPTRERLLQQALKRAPQTLADMERVGTPAKGFPAFDYLLTAHEGKAMPPEHCAFAVLIAQALEVEATALVAELQPFANKDWSESPESTRAAFAEWINQWLAGLERLRWAYIEKPLEVHRTSGAEPTPMAFARLQDKANWIDRQAQWKGLQAMARVQAEQRITPPAPGHALIPIEALLRGKGHLQLADKWAKALDAVSTSLNALPPQASPKRLLASAAEMKALAALFQLEVAATLDVPLGFSDADGD